MADFCSKRESDLQSLQNCSSLARGSSSRCSRSPAGGLPCDGIEGPAQPRCQAEMCHVPAVRWSPRKGHCLSREWLFNSLCGCCASVRAGNRSPFNMLTLLLMLSFPEQTVAMGQRMPSRMGTSGKEGLDWPNWWRKVLTSWSCGKSDKFWALGWYLLFFKAP